MQSLATTRARHPSLAAHLSPLSSHRVPLAANGTPHHTPLVPCTTHRIVIDEAQIVSNTASKAALMASELRRRYAWIVTGTPVNSSIKELEGLLSFLGSRPFAEQSVFGALVHNAFKVRGTASYHLLAAVS